MNIYIYLLILKLTYSIVKKIEKITKQQESKERTCRNWQEITKLFIKETKNNKETKILAWNRITEENL